MSGRKSITSILASLASTWVYERFIITAVSPPFIKSFPTDLILLLIVTEISPRCARSFKSIVSIKIRDVFLDDAKIN